MAWSLRRWRPRHLLLAWLAYWMGLVAVTVGPAVPAIMRATSADAKGSIRAAYGDQGLNLTVLADAGTAWSGTASLAAIAFWLAGPPLLLWLVWFVRRQPRAESRTVDPLEFPNAGSLGAGRAEPIDIESRTGARSKP